MITPLGSFVDPTCQDINFFLRERLLFIWHSEFRIVRGYSSDQFAVRCIAGNDNTFPRFGCVDSFVSEEETEVGVLLYSAMTGDAMFVEDGLDFCAEIDLIVAASPAHKNQQSRTGRNR